MSSQFDHQGQHQQQLVLVPPLALNKPPNYSKTLLLKSKSAQESKQHQQQTSNTTSMHKKIQRQLLDREQIVVKRTTTENHNNESTSIIVLENNRRSYTKYALPSQYGVRYPLPAEPQQNKASALRQKHQTGQFARINAAFDERKQREQLRQQLLDDIRRQQHEKYMTATAALSPSNFRRSATDSQAVIAEERRNAELRRHFHAAVLPSTQQQKLPRALDLPPLPHIDPPKIGVSIVTATDGKEATAMTNGDTRGTKHVTFGRSQSAPISGLTGVYHHDDHKRRHREHQDHRHDHHHHPVFLIRPSPSSIPSDTPRNLHQLSNNYYKNEIYLLEDENRKRSKEERDHLIKIYGLEAIQKLEKDEGTNNITNSSSMSPNSLHRMLVQERRRQTILMEKQRVLLSRQAQRIHLAQELHRLRTSGLAVMTPTDEEEEYIGTDADDNQQQQLLLQSVSDPEPEPPLQTEPTAAGIVRNIGADDDFRLSAEEFEVFNNTSPDKQVQFDAAQRTSQNYVAGVNKSENDLNDDVWRRPNAQRHLNNMSLHSAAPTIMTSSSTRNFNVIKHQHLQLQKNQQKWANETFVEFNNSQASLNKQEADEKNDQQQNRFSSAAAGANTMTPTMMNHLQYFTSPPPPPSSSNNNNWNNHPRSNSAQILGTTTTATQQRQAIDGSGSGGVFFFFPEQPQLPLGIPANASLRDPDFLNLSPRRDGGVELSPTSKRKLLLLNQSGDSSNAKKNVDFLSSSSSPATICDVSTHLPRVHLSNSDSANHHRNDYQDERNTSKVMTGHSTSLIQPPVPYYKRRQVQLNESTDASSFSSPIITPHHLKGGIVFNNNNYSNNQPGDNTVERNLDISVANVATENNNNNNISHFSSSTSKVVYFGDVSFTSTTSADHYHYSDNGRDSPLRRRKLQLEKQEWISRRQIEQDQFEEGYPLSQAAKMKLIAPKLIVSSFSSSSSSSSSTSKETLLTFTSLVPPLLLYDLVLSIAERAAWFESCERKQNQQDHHRQVGFNNSTNNNSGLFPKPDQFRTASGYYSQLWKEISSRETSAIFAAQNRFAQKQRNSLLFNNNSNGESRKTGQMMVDDAQSSSSSSSLSSLSFAPFFFLPPKSVLGPLLSSECGQIVANGFCRVNEDKIRREYLIAAASSFVKNQQSNGGKSGISNQGNNDKSPMRNIVQEDYLFEQNRQKQEENDESIPAVQTVQLSFKKPPLISGRVGLANSPVSSSNTIPPLADGRKRAAQKPLLLFSESTSSKQQASNTNASSSSSSSWSQKRSSTNIFGSSTMIGRAQLQIQAAEFNAAEDILKVMSEMILKPVVKEIVKTVVVTNA